MVFFYVGQFNASYAGPDLVNNNWYWIGGRVIALDLEHEPNVFLCSLMIKTTFTHCSEKNIVSNVTFVFVIIKDSVICCSTLFWVILLDFTGGEWPRLEICQKFYRAGFLRPKIVHSKSLCFLTILTPNEQYKCINIRFVC